LNRLVEPVFQFSRHGTCCGKVTLCSLKKCAFQQLTDVFRDEIFNNLFKRAATEGKRRAVPKREQKDSLLACNSGEGE
jgi:hypothetical protein